MQGSTPMPHIERNDLRLYYDRAGSGEPPLVFVHGWCCDHTFFAPQFAHFERSHAVTTYDLRGCGDSSRPDGGYDIATLTDDLAWLCEELEIERPVVVGHSLGGMMGIELAARYPDVPRAVIAVDPGPIDMLPEARTDFEGLLAVLERDGGGDAERRAFIEGMFLPADDPDRCRSIVETMCAVPAHVAAAVIRGVLAWDGPAALAACAAPLLVLRSRPGGSNDPARLVTLKPGVKVGMTYGAGHFHQLEVPEQVNAMMERFLEVAI
jgi:pimeloyl-ACP methyl ester carboxylesterase